MNSIDTPSGIASACICGQSTTYCNGSDKCVRNLFLARPGQILPSQFVNGEPEEDGEYVVRVSSNVAVIEQYVIDSFYRGKWLGSLKDTTLVYPVFYCKLPDIQIIP